MFLFSEPIIENEYQSPQFERHQVDGSAASNDSKGTRLSMNKKFNMIHLRVCFFPQTV